MTYLLFTIPIQKYFYMGISVLRGLAVSGTILQLEKTCVILYIDFVRGTSFQKAKIIQKLSVTVYYQTRLSDLDIFIKITITKIISFQHQKYSFNIKLLKLF